MLAGLNEVINEGKKLNIALGNYNTPNLESLWAVIDAAEEKNIPVIIAHAQCHEYLAPLDKIGPVMVEAAKRSKVKVCVHLDHGEDFEYCKRAIDLGFTSIMIDYSTLPYEENVKMTREMVEYAHARGVEVEGELGALPAREGSDEVIAKADELYTAPERVPEFLEATGVDALAIAFGTVHGLHKTRPMLNYDIITKVREYTDLPLVMHGGSGITLEEYKEVIRRGISKINYYSYMAYVGYEVAKELIAEKEQDYFHHIALRAQNAMKAHVLETMDIFRAE